MKCILLVEDEAKLRWSLTNMLEQYQWVEAENGQEAIVKLKEFPVDLVISDWRMPKMNGQQLLVFMQENYPDIPVIVITAYGDVQAAVTAMKHGAVDFITKPFELETLETAIETNMNNHGETMAPFADQAPIIGQDPAFLKLQSKAQRAAAVNVPVMIYGESGTGKELIARYIFANSPRKNRPFLPLNCAAVPANLLESELFGYEKGAFTGAQKRQKGYFEQAHEGILFLDEIGELPLELQAKLLRVLQEGEIQRLGAAKMQKVDVRIVAATNQDLANLVESGKFRQDLFYRLNVVPLFLPALRERPHDIEPLLHFFLEETARKHHLPQKKLSEDVLAKLKNYAWPGNIRELKNVIEYVTVMVEEVLVKMDDLPQHLLASQTYLEANDVGDSLPEQVDALERERISRALVQAQGNQSQAAKDLGISRTTLQYKIRKLNIDI